MYKSSIFTESLLPIIFSLIGLIFAGEILDLIQNWQLFLSDPELFILVPILLGLKGNLETCLSARLCTCANLGQLDSNNKKDDLSIYKIFTNCIASVSGSSTSQRWDILFGNFAVTQVQSLTIGFVAGIWSCILGSTGSLDKLALVACIGSICASISSGILSVFMSWAIITCKQRGLDPDNIAIPIAASLGDLLIVFGLALCGEAYGLVSFLDRYLPTVILFICFIMAYFWLVVVNKNKVCLINSSL